MEFKDKGILHYFKEVKCEQGFTTIVRCNYVICYVNQIERILSA